MPSSTFCATVLQKKPYLQATRALVEPRGEQRDEATIYLQLCKAAGIGLFGSSVAQKLLEGMLAVNSKLVIENDNSAS